MKTYSQIFALNSCDKRHSEKLTVNRQNDLFLTVNRQRDPPIETLFLVWKYPYLHMLALSGSTLGVLN